MHEVSWHANYVRFPKECRDTTPNVCVYVHSFALLKKCMDKQIVPFGCKIMLKRLHVAMAA